MLGGCRQVRLEDAGLYMCQINTDPMTSQSAWLSVQIPPDIDMARNGIEVSWSKAKALRDNKKFILKDQGLRQV